jgi:hypothetical protein
MIFQAPAALELSVPSSTKTYLYDERIVKSLPSIDLMHRCLDPMQLPHKTLLLLPLSLLSLLRTLKLVQLTAACGPTKHLVIFLSMSLGSQN